MTRKALIVDDSRFVRGLLRGLLEDKGIECEEAADGQAGLDKLHGDGAFDVAVLDDFLYAEPQAVPEPGSLILLGTGALVIARQIRRRGRR